MRFDDLPPDVICAVIAWISGENITRLWLCGNSMLNMKIEGGGARSWSSRCDSRYFFVFPPLLVTLRHLASICLVGPASYRLPPAGAVDMSLLPPTLTFLDLQFTGGATYFIPSETWSADLMPNLKTLAIGSTDISSYMVLKEMPHWPQNLESLMLRSSLQFPCLDPQRLPKALSTLSGSFSQLGDGPFPPLLTSLELQLNCITSLVSRLPSTLTSLSVSFVFNDERYDDASWSQLPADLKSLEADLPDPRMRHLLPYLPPQLDSLSLGWNCSLSEGNLASLPPNLTRLKAIIPSVVTGSFAQLLPRTLTSLEGYTSEIMLEAVPLLPPKLTNLSVTEDGSIDPEQTERALAMLCTFPLRTLRISGPLLDESTMFHLRQPMPTLQKLEFSLQFNDESLLFASLAHAPNLTSLDLGSFGGDYGRLFGRLPSSLRHLTCRATTQFASFDARLPPLTSLSIYILCVEEGQVLANFLPASLTKLEVGLEDSKAVGALFGAESSTTASFLPTRLPPNLATLSVHFMDGPRGEEYRHLLSFLPKSLTDFAVISTGLMTSVITDSDLSSLPPYLTSLRLPPSSSLTEGFLRSISKRLRNISIGSKQFCDY